MQTTKSHSLGARGGLALSFLIALVLVAPSCAKRDLRPLNPCTVSASSERLNVLPAEDIDLLFVIDNSGSMAEEQAALQVEIDRIIRTLIDQDELDTLAELPGNEDLIGTKAVKRLRVGTVSTDFGVAGFGQNETVQSLTAAAPGLPRLNLAVPSCGVYFEGPEVTGVDQERTRTGDRGVINLEPVFADLDGIACPASYQDFLAFDIDEDGTEGVQAFSDDVSCTAVLGTSGCGFEFQLESMLAAVTPSTSTAVSFAYGSGVADLPYPAGNAGFLREEALLAIIMITDEDDCSTDNPEVFKLFSTELADPNAPVFTVVSPTDPYRYNTRCTKFEDEALYPIQRYVSGLLAAKPVERLIFAGIVGVPPEAVDPVAQRSVEGFDAILAHPDMEVRDHVLEGSSPLAWLQIPGTTGDSQVPACWRCVGSPGVTDYMDCTTAGSLQYAVPADRIVRVARGLREEGVITAIETICADDFSPAVTNILAAIARGTRPSCLKRALNPDATGAVPCNFLETLPAGQSCANLEGREPTPFKVEDGREVCRLIQQIPTQADRDAGQSPEGLGWFYDDYTYETVGNPDMGIVGNCQAPPVEGEEPETAPVEAMVRFTDGTTPTAGARVRIDCRQPAQAERDINTPCLDDDRCRFADETGLNAFVVRWNLDASRFSVSGAQPMSCEPVTNTCQIDCQSDADCPGGMVCSPDDGSVCVDPTCNLR